MPSNPMLKLLLADWSRTEMTAKPIRQAVFIEEQNVPEQEEWDNYDENALHVVASLDGNPIGTARLTSDAVIGRMAVLSEFRGQGVGTAMLKQLIQIAKKSRLKTVQLNAQKTAVEFYAKHGFIAEGEEFMDAGIPHIKMQLDTTWWSEAIYN